MKKILGFILVLVVIGLLWYLAPQTASNPATETTPVVTDTPATGSAVSIKGYAFNPTPLRVQKGTTVTWTNQDLAAHTVTFDNGMAESPLISQAGTYTYTFTKVGMFAYHCSPHPYMKASIEVVE